MRIPKSWDDNDIYKDEPLKSAFQTLFQKHGYSSGLRPYQRGKSLDELIVRIKREMDGVKAVETWLNHVSQKIAGHRVVADGRVGVYHFSLFLNFFWTLFSRRNLGQAQEILNDSRCRRALADLSALTTSEIRKTNPSTSHVSGKHVCSESRSKRTIKEESHDSALHSALFPAASQRVTTSASVSSTHMNIGNNNPKKRPSTFSDEHHVQKRTVGSAGRLANNQNSKGFGNAKDRSGSQVKAGFPAKRSVFNAELAAVNPGGRQKAYKTLRFERSTEVTKSGAIPSQTVGTESVSFPNDMKTCDQDMAKDAGTTLEHPAYGVPETKPPAFAVNNAYPVHEFSTSRGSFISAADHVAAQEVNIKEEPLDAYRAYPSSPVIPAFLPSEALQTEDRTGETERLPKSEDLDFIQILGVEEQPMVLLTEQIEEELRWTHLPYPPLDSPCRFPKPPLQRFPPIWAESRQEICESFDWFRSYQGGVYFAHDVAKGYLLSAFPSSRDMFEHGGRLIISHGGGRAESLHSFQGHVSSRPASDQLAHDKSIRALFNNYFYSRPLALLMDDKYALFPFDLRAKGVTYAVLGFYTIAHVWAEYQPANNEIGRVVRFKFAFRWCEEQGHPWWHESEEKIGYRLGLGTPHDMESHTDSETTLDRSEVSTPDSSSTLVDSLDIADIISERRSLVEACKSCCKHSLRIFALTWVCLNPDCKGFWKQGNEQYLPLRLEYHPNFLILPPSKPIPPGFGSLEPASPQSFISEGNETNYAFSRGFHCHKCGRLSCRYKWESWECMNAKCQYTIKLQYPIRQASEFSYQTHPTSFQNHWINTISEIIQLPSITFLHESGRGILHSFLLPHDGAKIHHIQSGNSLGRKDADAIFHEYQIQAASSTLSFRRWPMRAHKCRGALLTNYFSQNSGEPYKYVGGDANTVPFDVAPDAVVKARSLIQKRIKQALNISAEFNEVLSAAYMERQRMAFHSDNEVGLGPLVAGLSLGSPAMMHFRLHPRHDPYREKKGILLSVVLRHGDILVMDGSGVQDYYEHTVVPENFRIAATARQINPGHA